jgi:hypothetical protein
MKVAIYIQRIKRLTRNIQYTSYSAFSYRNGEIELHQFPTPILGGLPASRVLCEDTQPTKASPSIPHPSALRLFFVPRLS